MNDETESFGLRRKDEGAQPVLCGVRAQGRLDGVLFELTLEQTYRNDTGQPIEVVYTFPLPQDAVLLGFAADLNGTRLQGIVVDRAQAEDRYESALADGDAPVLLERVADGLYTANIGNLDSGDQIVLAVRYAQLLRFEASRLRIAIPTTIAPRYGNPAAGGLQPQQVPQASLEVEYPLALTVNVAGPHSRRRIECPTHSIVQRLVDGERQLALADDARLDRDVVLLMHFDEPQPSVLMLARDPRSAEAPVVAVAALQPRQRPQTNERVALKLLVDCSGSMGGDSIVSARRALHGVLAALRQEDSVAFTRFGSTHHHVLRPSRCTPDTRQKLRALIDGTEADLGGTELAAALCAVLNLPAPDRSDACDVLLITDGETWNVDEVVRTAKASGQRVFAIGVGSAPAENVLRSLAEATGGACEFAVPGEALEDAAQRMVQRARQRRWCNLRVEWDGADVAWQGPAPVTAYGADTVIACAGFGARTPRPNTVRLLAAGPGGETIELARCEATAPAEDDTLARMAAATRLGSAQPAKAAALAVDYQLMSSHTAYVLVHERAHDAKTTRPAALHRVPSMLAAGWGATGRVGAVAQRTEVAAEPDFPIQAMFASGDGHAFMRAFRSKTLALEDIDVKPVIATLRQIAMCVGGFLHGSGARSSLGQHCRNACGVHPAVADVLQELVALGLSDDQAWLALAQWINERPNGLADASLQAVLPSWLGDVDSALLRAALEAIERKLRPHALDAWSTTRSRGDRLRSAMTRS